MAKVVKTNWRHIALVIIAFLFYSCSTIFSKLASNHNFLSSFYILYFGCVVLSLLVYAVLWQQILAIMDLSKAFLCKCITILFILAFSYFLFKENINTNNIIGSILIICGLAVLAWKR